jgi:DNA polymerase/3'-5' exonuclease PolX
LEGVGPGTVKRAHEFLESGEIADAKAFLNDPQEAAKKQLERVYGVGPKKASDLVEAGVTSLGDLKTRHELMQSELSDAQRTALRFAREIATPIKHATASGILTLVKNALAKADKGFSVEGVGGLRRKEATLTDSGVNLMITHAGYSFDDPEQVSNFRKKSAEEHNKVSIA